MARKRPTVPSLHTIAPPARTKKSTPYEDVVLGEGNRAARSAGQISRAGQKQPGIAAQGAARRKITYDTAMAIQEAKAGDDTALLPYQPTPSINPPRPRTLAAGYDSEAEILRVRFRDGTPWEYYNVPPNVWRNFKRVKSPGRFINRTLNNYPYARGDF